MQIWKKGKNGGGEVQLGSARAPTHEPKGRDAVLERVAAGQRSQRVDLCVFLAAAGYKN